MTIDLNDLNWTSHDIDDAYGTQASTCTDDDGHTRIITRYIDTDTTERGWTIYVRKEEAPLFLICQSAHPSRHAKLNDLLGDNWAETMNQWAREARESLRQKEEADIPATALRKRTTATLSDGKEHPVEVVWTPATATPELSGVTDAYATVYDCPIASGSTQARPRDMRGTWRAIVEPTRVYTASELDPDDPDGTYLIQRLD